MEIFVRESAKLNYKGTNVLNIGDTINDYEYIGHREKGIDDTLFFKCKICGGYRKLLKTTVKTSISNKKGKEVNWKHSQGKCKKIIE